ncbi:hypothetical protein PpBr36_08081 [Pyricularia pennisetigena]|uniref:hypothetical protein n=1 Tax=Pyricularia pennisetigena TaxID=1578925 RepID=UPI00114E0A42|nr:hypothetical protein PpBr36_08081 [Pyricularia pennisetigena]TLS24562.1 hypothetical protein PpBr36_08081 [Pyricularia pennisetigena]
MQTDLWFTSETPHEPQPSASTPAISSLPTLRTTTYLPSTPAHLSASRHDSRCLQHGTPCASRPRVPSRLKPPNSSSRGVGHAAGSKPAAPASSSSSSSSPPPLPPPPGNAENANAAHVQFHAARCTTYVLCGFGGSAARLRWRGWGCCAERTW